MKLLTTLSRITSLLPAMGLGVMVLAIALPLACPQVSVAAPQDPGAAAGQVLNEGGQVPLFGKITAIHNNSIELSNVNGETVIVKVTDKTEFRKDRQPAKRTDFKVGDVIIVRGEENPDHSWTAQVIGARSMNGPNGRGGGPGGGGPGGNGPNFVFGSAGTLGKDFVTGEIKSIDAPKLSVLRSDNVAQTLELNEETSLRKGRESITMADIQVGDHLFARGGVQNDVFVPKVVMIIGPEQWKRMQEMGGQPGGQRRPPAPPSNTDPSTQKPPEPQL
jgi:hypothetical protein